MLALALAWREKGRMKYKDYPDRMTVELTKQ